MERSRVSVSEEELKKGIEEDGADGYDAEVPDENWRLSEMNPWLFRLVFFSELKFWKTRQTYALLVYVFLNFFIVF